MTLQCHTDIIALIDERTKYPERVVAQLDDPSCSHGSSSEICQHPHLETKPAGLMKEPHGCKVGGTAALSFVIPSSVGII
jgi:hypothetical protein